MERVNDPVTGFSIPPSWLERCTDPAALEKIRSGRYVLLSDGRLLRRGLTTGTTASAACKGAVLSLRGALEAVDVMTPAGLRVTMPVVARDGFCLAVKDGGEHGLDVTSGMEVVAEAIPSDSTELVEGRGIGRIIRSGLCDEVGRPAISRSARRQIMQAIDEGLKVAGIGGARVELRLPKGEELAERTLNPRMGIAGGISILGSTGFVEPWNDHLLESRMEELRDEEKVVVTTGRCGLRYSRLLFPDHKAVLMGSGLERLSFQEGQESVLCGLPALILRWAWPEILEGTGYGSVTEMAEREPGHRNIDLALQRIKERLPETRVVLLYRDGRILRDVR